MNLATIAAKLHAALDTAERFVTGDTAAQATVSDARAAAHELQGDAVNTAKDALLDAVDDILGPVLGEQEAAALGQTMGQMVIDAGERVFQAEVAKLSPPAAAVEKPAPPPPAVAAPNPNADTTQDLNQQPSSDPPRPPQWNPAPVQPAPVAEAEGDQWPEAAPHTTDPDPAPDAPPEAVTVTGEPEQVDGDQA